MRYLLCFFLCLFGFTTSAADEGSLSQFVHMTYHDKEHVAELISTLASNHVGKLLFKRKHMNRLGDSVRHVPPIEFLGYIFSRPDLRNNMNEIRQSYFKWSNFIDGLAENIERELYSGRLMSELEEFALLVDRDVRELENAAQERNWNRFVQILL